MVFSVVNAVLWHPLPFTEAHQLATVWETTPENPDVPVSYLNYLDVKQGNQVFEDMALIDDHSFVLTGAGMAERLHSGRVTANFFQVLGVQPLMGRLFEPQDDIAGNGQVVILSHRLWQSRFGGDPEILGRTIMLNDLGYTVIWVLPAALDHQQFVWFRELKGWEGV